MMRVCVSHACVCSCAQPLDPRRLQAAAEKQEAARKRYVELKKQQDAAQAERVKRARGGGSCPWDHAGGRDSAAEKKAQRRLQSQMEAATAAMDVDATTSRLVNKEDWARGAVHVGVPGHLSSRCFTCFNNVCVVLSHDGALPQGQSWMARGELCVSRGSCQQAVRASKGSLQLWVLPTGSPRSTASARYLIESVCLLPRRAAWGTMRRSSCTDKQGRARHTQCLARLAPSLDHTWRACCAVSPGQGIDVPMSRGSRTGDSCRALRGSCSACAYWALFVVRRWPRSDMTRACPHPPTQPI